MAHRDWLGLKGELPEGLRLALTILSFVVPLVVWSLVSYLPFLWHPLTRVTDPGGVEYFVEGMEVPNAEFAKQFEKLAAEQGLLPKGVRVNPVYLPAPHEVLWAFVTAFTTPPRLPNEPWLHESLATQYSNDISWLSDFLAGRRARGNSLRNLPLLRSSPGAFH